MYNPGESQYAAYSEYTYEYEGQILSGLPDVSREYAGLKIKSNVKLQVHSGNRFLMQLRDIQLCKLHKELDSPEKQQLVMLEDCEEDDIIREHKQHLEKRIEFYWTKGLISQISSLRSDPDHSVNIKRGVLELLHVNLEGSADSKYLPKSTYQKEFYSVMEQGIAGECESVYNVKVHVSQAERRDGQILPERDGLNVTKVRNFEKCVDRPTRMQALVLKGRVCKDCKDREEDKLLKQLSQVRYNITGNRKLFIIDSVVADGKHIFEPIGKDNGQAVTFVNQSLVRKEATKLPALDDPKYLVDLDDQDRKDQSSLKYVFPEERQREVIAKETHGVECEPMSKAHELHGQIEQLLNNVVKGINEYVSEDSLDQLQLLKERLRGLNRTELCHCMNHFGQDLINDAELNEKRRMILEDLLPLLGSLHSVEVLYRRIESRRIVGNRASELVSGLAFHPKPDDQILDTMLELCMSDAASEDAQLKQTCWLSFGSMVNTACKHGDRMRCPEIKEDRYMRALIAGIDHRRPQEERRMCMKAIGNAGIHFKNSSYNLLEKVQSIIKDEKETSSELKSQAIYSLRRITEKRPEEVRIILTPLFCDQSIDPEVRIAAFVVTMDTQPDHLSIQMLAQCLQKEKSRQVGNFVYSYLKGLAESKIPCKKNVSIGAQEALKIAKKFENGLQYSKSYHLENSVMRKKMSAALNLNWLASEKSSFGAGGSAKLSAKVLGHNMNWLEVGYHTEHMEELAQQVMAKLKGKHPKISEKFQGQQPQQMSSREILMGGEQSSSLKDLVRRMDTEVNITQRHPESEPISASAYVKVFGNELRYMHLEKALLEDILAGRNTDLRDLEVELSANQPQMKYQKALTLVEGWQQWPTSMGIPISLNLTNSVIIAMHATGKAEMRPSLQQVLSDESIKAKKLEISGIFNPRMGMLTTGKLGVSLHHHMKAGVAYESIVNSSMLINGSLKFDFETLRLESSMQAPQHNHTIVSLKMKPYTFSLMGEQMPKKYHPSQHSGMMNMMQRMRMPVDEQQSMNEEQRRIIQSHEPLQMKKTLGNRTMVAELSANYSLSHLLRPSQCLLSGPANISLRLLPGMDRPETIKIDAKISDWKVTPEQYEDHILRSSRRQYIEPRSGSSSESGSRSFKSAERFQDVMLPGDYRSNSKELHLPTAIPASLEEQRFKESFNFDTAHWTKEDLRVMPMSVINRIMGEEVQDQEEPGMCEQKLISLKQIFLNITAKGSKPQSELLTAITLDYKDYIYKALTVDIISESKLSEEEKRVVEEQREELERLRSDPLNTGNEDRIEFLEEKEEEFQMKRGRQVMCLQGEMEYPDFKTKEQSVEDLLPKHLADDMKVKYKMGLQYGKSCEMDKKIQILAKTEKSKEQRMEEARYLRGEKSLEEQQCQLDRQRGEKYSYACKQVQEDRNQLRSLHLDVSTKIGKFAHRLSQMVGDVSIRLLSKVGMLKKELTLNEQDKIQVSLDLSKKHDNFNMSVRAPLRNIKLEKCRLPTESFKLPALYAPMKPMSKSIMEQMYGQAKPRCKVTSLDKVITFDNVTYDYELTKCHHILAKDCSPSEQFLVLARKQDQSRPQKDTIIHLAGHKIEFIADDSEGVRVRIDDVNMPMSRMDKLIMREDNTMEKKNIQECKRRELMDVIQPNIADEGITSSEIYRILTHKSRHQTPPPPGFVTPRRASHSSSHSSSASESIESRSWSFGSTSSEEVKMREVEKEMWKEMKAVMMLTFDGLDQGDIMRLIASEEEQRTEDGYLIDLEEQQSQSKPLLWIFRTTRSVMLYDARLGLFVTTCGANIKVEIARYYQDMVCGMCGHFNGEQKDELEGPSFELYKSPKQFAISYQLESVPQECVQECVPRMSIQKQDVDLDSCYSKVLVPRCQEGCRPAEVKRVKTDFVCIDRDSGLKQSLDESIQRQRPHEVIRKLGQKLPDFVEEIEIHTRCQQ